MNIRYATSRDVEEINKLFLDILASLKYYNELAKEDEMLKYSKEELVKKIADDKFSVLGVFDNDILIGFCFSRFDDYTIWLEWFGISSNYRGKQLGSKILSKLEVSAKERNCHKVWCDSRTENIASFKVLQQNGYTLITTLKNHWYNQDFFIWQKLLH